MSILSNLNKKLSANSVTKNSVSSAAEAAHNEYDLADSNFRKVSQHSREAMADVANLLAAQIAEAQRIEEAMANGSSDSVTSPELTRIETELAAARRLDDKWSRAATIADDRRMELRRAWEKLEKAAILDEFITVAGKLAVGLDSHRAVYKELVEIWTPHSRDLPSDIMEAASLMMGDAGLVTSFMMGVRQYLSAAKPAPALPAGHVVVKFKVSTAAEGRFNSIGAYSIGEVASFEHGTAMQLISRGVAERV